MARNALARAEAKSGAVIGAPKVKRADALIDHLPPFVRRDRGWLSEKWRAAFAAARDKIAFCDVLSEFIRLDGKASCEYPVTFFDRETTPVEWDFWEDDSKTLQGEPDYNVIIYADDMLGAIVFRKSVLFTNPDYAGTTPSPGPADTSQHARMRDDLNTAVKNARAQVFRRDTSKLRLAATTAAYKAMLKHVDLLNPRLAEDERLRRAARLLKTYNRIRKRDPEFHDDSDQLRAARRIQMADYRRRKRAVPQAREAAYR
jgi:hypothetical protein